MKKDDIIALLGEQLKASNEQLKAANMQVSTLTATVCELTARIKNLEEMLVAKGVALEKQERISKALGNIAGGKKSEQQKTDEGKAAMTVEEYQKMLEERRARIKARGNNGATTGQSVMSTLRWKRYMLTWSLMCRGTYWLP